MKRKKHKEIIHNSLEGHGQGYSHRRHRGKKNNKVNSKTINHKRVALQKMIDKEWEELSQRYNIIGYED